VRRAVLPKTQVDSEKRESPGIAKTKNWLPTFPRWSTPYVIAAIVGVIAVCGGGAWIVAHSATRSPSSWMLLFIAVALMISGFILLFRNKPAAMGTSYIASILSAFLASQVDNPVKTVDVKVPGGKFSVEFQARTVQPDTLPGSEKVTGTAINEINQKSAVPPLDSVTLA
jgi:hypothetical protein